MEIRAGGGVFRLGNPGGRGGHSDPGNPGRRGGQKPLPSVVGGGVDFFWNNPLWKILLSLDKISLALILVGKILSVINNEQKMHLAWRC